MGGLRDNNRLEKGANRNLMNFNEGQVQSPVPAEEQTHVPVQLCRKGPWGLGWTRMDTTQQCVFVAKGLTVS